VRVRVADLIVGEQGKALDLTFSMRRSTLEAMIKPAIQRSINVCADVLGASGLDIDEIESVILVGGSTRIPYVQQMVQQLFQKVPKVDIDPDLVVALGASIQAFSLAEKEPLRSAAERGVALRRTDPGENVNLGLAPAPPPPPAPARDEGVVDLPQAVARADFPAVKGPPRPGPQSKAKGVPPRPPPADRSISRKAGTDRYPSVQQRVPGSRAGELDLPDLDTEIDPDLPTVRRSVSPAVMKQAGGIDLSTLGFEDLDAGLDDQPLELGPVTPASDRPAARQEAVKQSVVMTPGVQPILMDVTPHSLGVETVSGICEHLIRRNAPIPVEQSQVFTTARDGQDVVRLNICQGESRSFAENQALGEVELTGLRPAPRGQVKIEVTFMLDANGTLDVRAVDRETMTEQRIRINLLGGVAEDQLASLKRRQESELGV
jgi:molecular chaperone DnaK